MMGVHDEEDCDTVHVRVLTDSWRALNLSVFLLVFITVTLSLVWWYKNRRNPHLRMRPGATTVALGVHFLLNSYGSALYHWSLYSPSFLNQCEPTMFLISYSSFLLFFALLVRVMIYFFKLKLIEHLIEGFALFEQRRKQQLDLVNKTMSNSSGNTELSQEQRKSKKGVPISAKSQCPEPSFKRVKTIMVVSTSLEQPDEHDSEVRIRKLLGSVRWYQKMSSSSAATKAMLIGAIISIPLSLLNLVKQCSAFNESEDCSVEIHVYGTLSQMSIFSVIGVLVLLYAHWRRKKYPDTFHLLLETTIICVLRIVLFVFAFSLEKLDPGNFHEKEVISFEWTILHDFNILILLVYVLPYQVFLSRNKRRTELDLSFEKMLKNPIGQQMFKQHLKHEYSAPNLSFWRAMTEWKDTYDSTKDTVRTTSAKNIYRRWLSNRSPTEVAVSGPLRLELETVLDVSDVYKRDMFDKLINEVYTLMENDSFYRFQQTKLYKVYLGLSPSPADRSLSSMEIIGV